MMRITMRRGTTARWIRNNEGIIDYDNDLIEVYGNFYLYQELNILSGKDLVANTNLSNFKANEVSYIYNNDLKIDSNKAERSDNIIEFYDNFLFDVLMM